jgi:aminoglycoside phosphotransferase (APT) family kinase protein
MGALARCIATVAVDGLDLDGPWARVATLRTAAASWAEAVRGSVDASTQEQVRAAIGRVAVERTFDDHGGRPLLRHGDFAPINVVVEPGGQAVLLDFEHARATPLPIDAAWWAWVVDHHHPAAWRRVGGSFLAAAGCAGDVITRRLLADVALLLLLERAAAAAGESDAEGTGRWLDRLVRAATRGGLSAYDAPTT